ARARAQLTRPPSGAESGRAALSAGFGISVRAVKPGLDPALPVLLLRAEHIPHHGSLAVVLGRARLPAALVAGTVRRRCLVAHRPSPFGHARARRPAGHHCPAGTARRPVVCEGRPAPAACLPTRCARGGLPAKFLLYRVIA